MFVDDPHCVLSFKSEAKRTVNVYFRASFYSITFTDSEKYVIQRFRNYARSWMGRV